MAIEIIIRIDETENEKRNDWGIEDNREHLSSYAKIFDDACPGWSTDPEMNKHFLLTQQNFANEKLRYQGYLFLNDVYTMLGMSRTKAGQIVGWIYDEKNPRGDNYVDFDLYSQHNIRFINGLAREAILDFNVDGVILDNIP